MRFGLPRGSTGRSAFKDAPGSTIAIDLDSRVTVFSPAETAAGIAGGLIHTALGSGLGDGRPFGNRSGFFANASASTSARWSRFAAASP